MKFNAAKCECGYVVATPEERPKCRECGKDMVIVEKGSPEYAEVEGAIKGLLQQFF